jgi:hypothetical protein
MRRVVRSCLVLTPTALFGLTGYALLRAGDPVPKPGGPPAQPATADPKPLSDAVKKGLAYLAAQQLPSGGWAQGEESQQMRGNGEPSTVANVGDTCAAALALVRAGSTPKDGPYAQNVARAVAFVCAQVEKSLKDGLSVTDVKGTRLQGKLGGYVDTFLASLLLAEVKGKMADEQSEKMACATLDRVVAKMAKNQKNDGGWANAGWAPVLAQSIAAKGLNRAAQNGVKVDEQVLARVEKNARDNFLRPTTNAFSLAGSPASASSGGITGGVGGGLGALGAAGGFKVDGTSANVPLYSFAGNAAAGQDAVNTRKINEAMLKKVADDPKAPPEERKKAQDKLKEVAKDNEKAAQAQEDATKAVVKQLGDKQFIAGFGSNGGEEFLSYMQISETLLGKGGKEWQDWDKAMAENLARIQNPDGSWSGHHCITGRTFCTAAALLVLTADRAPVPAAGATRDKK